MEVLTKQKTKILFVVIIVLNIGFTLCGRTKEAMTKTNKCQFDGRCRCKSVLGEMYDADCSNRYLKEIPRFPNNILRVKLSHNVIGHIPKGIFSKNTKLEILDLSYNRLQNLSDSSFSGLINLQSLLINNNNITDVHKEAFLSTKNLQIINFKKNTINSLQLNFSSVISLITARLDFTLTEEATLKQFWGLQSLRNLDLSGLTGNCRVKTLTPYTFELMPQLESLNISACFINYIYIGTFKMLSRLSFLDVSLNRCLKSTGVENITQDLPYTSIQSLKINNVRQVFDLTVEVKIANMAKLSLTNLTELYAEGNRIQLFEEGALGKLPPSMKHLSLADNFFSYGVYFRDFPALPVHSVNLSFLFGTHDPRIREESCDYMNRGIHDEFNSKTDHNSHSASIILPANGEGSFGCLGVPPNMTSLVYKQCNLRFEIPKLCISNNKLKYADGSFNIFYSWVGPVVSLDRVEHLDLSNNFCVNVSNVFFLRLRSLKYLFIQNNFLGFVLPQDTRGSILSHVETLQTLDLSFNRIPRLPYYFFRRQTLLQNLSLNDNMLDEVSFRVDHMINLSIFNLANNRISILNKNVTNQLERIYTKNKHLKVDLSGNPLQCTCDTLEFIEWVYTTQINLNTPSRTRCILQNKTVIRLSQIKSVFPMLKKQCRSYTSVIIGTLSLVVLFMSVLVWGLIYRHRWKLRYLYYMIKSRHHGTIKAPNNTYDNVYEYDAFISYANGDSEFVHGNLIERLEKEAGLKLCIHKRDFLPGNDIASNITSAVHVSRKTVVIMSPSYLDSDWCMFEYNMAKMESIYSRDKENILFLIFLKQVKPSLLPLHVLELVHSQSYIEFPDDQYGETVFWDKVREVLSS